MDNTTLALVHSWVLWENHPWYRKTYRYTCRLQFFCTPGLFTAYHKITTLNVSTITEMPLLLWFTQLLHEISKDYTEFELADGKPKNALQLDWMFIWKQSSWNNAQVFICSSSIFQMSCKMVWKTLSIESFARDGWS